MSQFYWEMLLDDLRKEGWSVGFVSFVDDSARLLYCADAHKDDGRRFVGHGSTRAEATFALLESVKMAEQD